jgi:hypothetical protein
MSQQTQGRVIAAHGRHYTVELSDKTLLKCYPRGKKNEAKGRKKARWNLSSLAKTFYFARMSLEASSLLQTLISCSL